MPDRQPSTETILSCPLCNSHSSRDYSVVGYGYQPRGGVPHFAVLRCRRHGVEFADALPATPSSDTPPPVDSLAGLYGGDPQKASPRYVDFMDRVEAIVGMGNRRVLHDVGCGLGHLLFEARRRGWSVQGSDIAAGVRSIIEKSDVPCFIGSLAKLNLPGSSCDVVTSFCVLPHHLTEPTPDMLAVSRMLKPGGWFVLQFPDDGSFRRMAKMAYRVIGDSSFSRQAIANVYGPGGHQFAFTRKNLAEYLGVCGFQDTIFQSYAGSPRCTLMRFGDKPLWYRAAATAAVYGLKATSSLLRMPNHSIVFARK